MAKYLYDNYEYYGDDGGEDCWPWTDNNDDSAYDFFPHWFPDSIKYEWEMYLDKLMPKGIVYTHDVPELNRSRTHLVFVYGTLKKGGFNNRLIKGAHYIGKAWSKVKCLKMYVNDYNVPVVFFTSQSDGHSVQGELYRCSTEMVRDLDRIEANGDYYKRRKIVIEADDGTVDKAFMYFGLHSAHDKSQLTLSNIFTRKKTGIKYFSYTPKLRKSENHAL